MSNVNHEYNSTVFALICEDKNNLLEIYNGLNGTSYTNVDDLEITTVKADEGASGIFMRFRNDASFLFNFQLNIYEHQSTVNPNIPLRDLFYVAEQYAAQIPRKPLYGSKAVKIPAPRFILFYNGARQTEDDKILRLSDLFEQPMDQPELELTVRSLNITVGHNRELLEKCRCLEQYSEFVDRMRNALRGMTGDTKKERAAESVIDKCICDGILADILNEKKEAVIRMSIWEYDEEAHYAALREDGYDDGYAKGLDDGREAGLAAGLEEGHAAGLEEGLAAGRQEGFAAGALRKQIELISRKVRKGKTLPEIASDLDEDQAAIEPIYRAVVAAAPEYDIEKIMAGLINN